MNGWRVVPRGSSFDPHPHKMHQDALPFGLRYAVAQAFTRRCMLSFNLRQFLGKLTGMASSQNSFFCADDSSAWQSLSLRPNALWLLTRFPHLESLRGTLRVPPVPHGMCCALADSWLGWAADGSTSLWRRGGSREHFGESLGMRLSSCAIDIYIYNYIYMCVCV